MLNDTLLTDKALLIEKRITKVEVSMMYLQDELRDIKHTLRWVIGIIFGLNTTIIGIVAKGFNII